MHAGVSRRWVNVLAAGLVTLIWVGVGSAQPTDPMYGTWKLDVAKSTFSPGPGLREQTVTIEPDGPGRKVTVVGVDGTGAAIKWGYSGTFDREDNPITGTNPDADVVSLRRLGPTTTRSTFKKAGKETLRTVLSLSDDGKAINVLVEGVNAQGRPVKNTLVFVKQ